jgi:DNA helicase IV
VLLVGPNATFLRYIEQVLPSLGETGVVLSTHGDLLPGVTATANDADDVALVKGDLRMVEVIAAAVEARQRVPRRPIELAVDGHHLVLRPHVVAAARARARQRRKPYNEGRSAFLLELLDHLAGQLARATGTELDADTKAELRADLRDSKAVRRELNLLWMPLTPQRLLTRLYSDPAALGAAGAALTPRERRLLRRDPNAPWTVADVPLLDEAAELLGDDTSGRTAADHYAAEERRRDIENAQQALVNVGAGGHVTAEMLADRFTDHGPVLSVAERAANDRTWAFGHVVVDEAQELSAMAWRMLMRRCPSRSMTVVGDLAQTGSSAGAASWAEVLDPYVAGRWRLEELTVNYRTPRQIMDLAAAVLASSGSTLTPPRSVREGVVAPTAERVLPRDLVAAVLRTVEEEVRVLEGGRLAVIAPAKLLSRARPGRRHGASPGRRRCGAGITGDGARRPGGQGARG